MRRIFVFVILSMDKIAVYDSYTTRKYRVFKVQKYIDITCMPSWDALSQTLLKHTRKIYAEKIPAKISLFCTKLKYLLRMNIPYFRPDGI